MQTTAWITSTMGVGAVIAALIAVSIWLEKRFRSLAFLGSAILVITGGAVLANLHIIPSALVADKETMHPVYAFANDVAVPLSIVLLLISADLKSVRLLGRSSLIAFGLASVGTVLGTLLAIQLTAGGIGPESWKLAGQFVASYIGGGINYAAVGEALETSETMYATGAAADNIMTNLWMVATAVLPPLLRAWYPSYNSGGADESITRAQQRKQVAGISLGQMGLLLAVAFLVVWIGDGLAPMVNEALKVNIPAVLWYTTLAILLSLFTPLSQVRGGMELGHYLLHFFFATMGAGTILSSLVDKGPIVFLFLVILVAIHALIVFGLGKVLKLEVEMLAIASQATVGGPSTALALATAKRWDRLVAPGVLMGLLGYAIGNYVGIGVGTLVKAWLG
ncbi:DUF819 domain-containing protein [Laceyella putida]|uniref:DUF819 domain-containing protein n=1 Tax=Laceyella putida TaxID=110101 RepID=A0ABW2RMQ6_9BACL